MYNNIINQMNQLINTQLIEAFGTKGKEEIPMGSLEDSEYITILGMRNWLSCWKGLQHR